MGFRCYALNRGCGPDRPSGEVFIPDTEHQREARVSARTITRGENPMRHIVLTIAAITLLTPAALAQAPAQQGPQNPAVKSMDQNNSSAPSPARTASPKPRR